MKTKVRSFRKFFIEQLEFRRLLASDFLLEIDGIKGESTDAKHPGAIELESFSWGASNPQLSGPASPLTTEEFRFVTPVSQATPQLYSSLAQGKHITKATLYVRKAGDQQQEYLKIKLSDILVSSIQSRSLNEELPIEEVAFTFAKIDQSYSPTKADGSLDAPIVSSWDLSKSKAKVELSPSLLSQRPSSNNDQTDAFIQISGIKGESTDAKHKDWLQLESFSFGISQDGLNANGNGGGAGKVNFQDFHFVTSVSKATPLLAKSTVNGDSIKEVLFEVRRGDDPKNPTFLQIKLVDVLVSSYQTVASSNSDPLEEVTLSFKSMTQSYSSQKSDGTSAPSSVAQLSLPASKAADPSELNLLAKTIPTQRSSDIFLEIDGIKGESTDAKHTDEIQIDSFSWGVSNASSSARGNGAGAGKVSLQDFHFVSSMGKASPLLMKAVATGNHIKFADLSVRKTGENPFDYLKIEMDDLLVTSYDVQSLNNTTPSDSVSLNFTKIKMDYQELSATGLPAPSTSFTWTVPASVARVPNTIPVPNAPASDPAAAAVDYYLVIDGIKGESAFDEYKGAIEIESFSWGLNQSGAYGRGGGGGAGKVNFQDFHFVAPVSAASPQLVDAVIGSTSSKNIAKATLFVRKSGAPYSYAKLELSDLRVESIQVQSINNSQPTEEFALNFTKLDFRNRSDSSIGLPNVTQGSVVVAFKDEQTLGPSILDATKTTPAGFDSFLEIDGIKGESTDRAHKGSIEIESFSWGATNAGSKTSGNGLGSGKVSMQDFHFVMSSSSATPELISALARGKHFTSAVLQVRRGGDQGGQTYYKYKLADVIISSYHVNGTNDTTPTEEISLNFTKLRNRYSSYKLDSADGTVNAVATTATWRLGQSKVEYVPGASILAKTTPAPAAFDAFLKIDGIKGESSEYKHKDWIELQSYQAGASRTITSRDRGGIGELVIDDFSFQADVSKASPALLDALATKRSFPNAVLEVRNRLQMDHYLKIKLVDILVSSYQVGGTNQAPPLDSVRLGSTGFEASYGSVPVDIPTLADATRIISNTQSNNSTKIPSAGVVNAKNADIVYALPDYKQQKNNLPIPIVFSRWDPVSLYQEEQVDELLKSM